MLDLIKKKRIVFLSVATGVIYACILYLVGLCWPLAPSWIPLVILFMILMGWITFIGRQLWVHQREQTIEIHRWNEAWASIHSMVPLNYPLPPSTSFTIAPDAALHIMKEVLRRRPAQIVELGGGLSTLLLAGLVRKYQIPCSILTIESDEEYLAKLRYELVMQELNTFVTLMHAPIEEVNISNGSHAWYKISGELPNQIDFLLVDGPPKVAGSLSRYPALPYFSTMLKIGAVVFLDDAGRPDMQETIQQWKAEFPSIQETPVYLSRTISKLEI